VLLVLVSALAWSRISPTVAVFGLTLPTFWGQVGACTALVLVALFCGFLQGRWGLTPAEVSFDPPPAEDGHHAHH
jgi:hypothetical protein